MTAQGAKLSTDYGEEERLRTELMETRAELEVEIAARRRLEHAVIDMVDNERQRLAQMLHDTLCQSLGGIGLLARVILRRLEGAGREEAGEVAELGRVIDEATRALHSVVRWLRPAAVDGQDVVSALTGLASSLFQGIPCEFHCPAPVVLSDHLTAAQLVQIAYQAVNDTLRRPGIRRVVVSLSMREGCLVLTVKDDGLPPGAAPTAEILAGRELMRLRADSIGATLTISSQAKQGTSIICTLPRSN